MDELDQIQQRLRGLGEAPIDPAVQSAHLTAMAHIRGRRTLRPKLRTAAAFLVGLLIGGSGLAAAGALPDPAQHAAHRVLDQVGIDVPNPERYHGPECGDEVKRNHGAYTRDDKALATTDCGKPVGAGGEDEADDEGSDEPKEAKGPCNGKPAWAGPNKKSMTPEEKAAAQAAREVECGADDEADEGADESRETSTAEPSTTEPPTTEPPTTTTTEAATTTTQSSTPTTAVPTTVAP